LKLGSGDGRARHAKNFGLEKGATPLNVTRGGFCRRAKKPGYGKCGYARPCSAAHRQQPDPASDPGQQTKEATMTIKLVALVLLCLMTGTAVAQEPKVTSLMSKDLPENPGREALMITVEHAPGGSSAIHRHNAHAFVYVLEGSVVMQLKGGQQVTLTPGQTFYEGPADVHVVDRNASGTQPAKFLVLLIKDKGAPALVPAQ
jgi:quercetin dioxygenase-like cupin family protein